MLLSWGERREDGGMVHLDLLRDDEIIASFTQSKAETVARVKPEGSNIDDVSAWDQWSFDPAETGAVSAHGPAGQEFIAVPEGGKADKGGKIARAKFVDLYFDGRDSSPSATVEDCGKQDFVIEIPATRALDGGSSAATAGSEGNFSQASHASHAADNAAGTKIAQFTGGDRGVRHVTVELEQGQEDALTVQQQVFVAWLARIQLESRLVASTWMWTVLLLVLLPIMLLAFFLQ